MAKKKPRSRSSKKQASVDWRAIGRWSMRGLSIAMLVGLAIGLTFGVDRLRGKAEADLRLAAFEAGGGVEIGFVWPRLDGRPGETWLPGADQEVLHRAATRALGEDSPLSGEPLRRVARELGEMGWFVGDPVVRRTGVGRVLVEGEWRVPAAVVRWEGDDWMISASGLPMTPVYLAGRSGRPVITGAYVGPVVSGPDAYQKQWRDPGVTVALGLLAELGRAGMLEHIGGVDIAGYLEGGPIELVSADGNRVVWGSPVGEWKPGEPTVEEKLGRLRALVGRTGSIDAGQARVEIHRARVEIDRSASPPAASGDD